MFETVVPETFAKRSKKIFYETLPVSIAAHALVIAAVLLGAIWNVAFPDHSPHLIAAYSLTALPDPPPATPRPARGPRCGPGPTSTSSGWLRQARSKSTALDYRVPIS